MSLLVSETKLRSLLETFAEDIRWGEDGGEPEETLIEKFIEECKIVLDN